MYKIQSIDDLKTLIADATEESTELEFKLNFGMPEDEIIIIDKDKQGKKKKDWKTELAKDVSAMANSAGGTIIFGISEEKNENDKNIASELVPISNSKMDKDRLTRLLIENIRPEICFEITHIKAESENAGFFIVNIPQGTTAYQNKRDHRYYIRHNAIVESMEDYQIRDIMNRNKTPIINLEFQLIKTTVNVIEKNYNFFPTRGIQENKSQRIDYRLKYRPFNNGQILAKYINYFVYIPSDIVVDKEDLDIEGDYCIVFGDNTTRDLVDISVGQRKYGPVRYDPILPGIYGSGHGIDLCFDNVDIKNLPCIKYEMHADNAPSKTITVEWTELECLNQTKTEIIDPMAPPRIPGY